MVIPCDQEDAWTQSTNYDACSAASYSAASHILTASSHLWLMLGRGAKLTSGVEVPVFLPRPVNLAVKDLPAFMGSVAANLDVMLTSSSNMLLTSALPLLLTSSLTAAYTCPKESLV